MTGYRRIIWDWNGTIIDDVDVCVDIINESLLKRNLPAVSRAKYREIFEFPVINYYKTLGFNFENESFERIGAEYIKAYASKMYECQLHARVYETIKAFNETSREQYILSALEQFTLDRITGHFNLRKFFRSVCGGSDFYAFGKVELGRRLFQEIGTYKSTVMIGDTVHDFEVAEALGIDCILAAAGHNSEKRLKSCGVPVVNSYEELQKLITLE